MLRKLLLAFLVLVVVLVVVVDRVGGSVASHVLAGKLESDERLSSRPAVSIGGFPFLTQAFGGDYHDVKVTTRDFTTSDHVEIDTLTVHLHGVHVPLSKVVSGSVSTVPIDHADGTAFLSYADITTYLEGKGLAVTLAPTSSGAISVVGRSSSALFPRIFKGVARLGVSQSVLTLSLTAGRAISKPIVLPIPLRALPFRIVITSVQVGASGITGTGVANNVVLGS
jgi:hypothetical protein